MKWLFVSAFLTLLASTAFGEEMQIGSGLACDQAAQVQSFLENVADDPVATVKQVNTEANDPDACVLGSYAFYKGKDENTVRNKDGAWVIAPILVVAIHTPGGWQRINPIVWYSAFKKPEGEA